MYGFIVSFPKKFQLRWMALRIIKAFFVVFLITTCTPSPPPQEPPPSDRDRDGDDPEDRDKDREGGRRFTDSRVGECNEDKKCKEICGDIFRSRNNREECEERSISEVTDMEEVFKVLEEPDTDDLEALNLEVLKELLDISTDPLKNAISDMTVNGKREFLVWFAEDSEAATILINAEDEDDIRDALFPRFIVSPSSRSDLNQSIGGGKTFVEVALKNGNEPVLEWLHSSFESKCDQYSGQTFQYYGTRELYPICVFDNYYCALDLDTELEEEYFDYEFFTDLLDDVLVHGRKRTLAPSWWTTSIEADDLETWSSSPHNVCLHMLSWYAVGP